jgi:DNA/RNA-binding domain of Phe-tRNA-synthetase-like protein
VPTVTTVHARLIASAHPLAMLAAFVAHLPAPLGELESPDWLRAGLRLEFDAPLAPPDDAVRKAVRELLRAGGYKPSGRSKPASEFLQAAAARGELGSINLAVDLCNVVSLHSGLPISVVDLELAASPLQVALAPAGTSYVFNPSGQSIDLGGLLCLHDQAGPCASPVKDSQRSKTHAGTRWSLQLVWGTTALPERVGAAVAWYRDLHERLGIATQTVEIERG